MDLLSFLFPRRCLRCRQVGSYLCHICVDSIQPMIELYCPVCRKPSRQGITHVSCRHTYEIDGLISCYEYSGVMTNAIAKFKYSLVKDLTETLIELMISSLNQPLFFEQYWLLVPVPLSKSRKQWRGFNQAELLAQGLAKNFNWEVTTSLIYRVKNTLPQMQLSRDRRQNNLKNSFQVKSNSASKNILLIDDVATTCSTLRECAKELKKAGANKVWGLTLAQAIPR